MIREWLMRAWTALWHPKVRLKADFPWGFGTMAKYYVVASILYFLGSLIPVAVFSVVVAYLAANNPELFLEWFGRDAQNSNMGPIVITVVTSFICGFSLQSWYIARCFHRQGLSLRKSMGLNLDSLGGSWWAAIWRAAAAFALVLAIDVLLLLVPVARPQDPVAEFARKLDGLGFLAFAVIAVLGAPLFEEFVFRGFLFNMCRTSFRQGWFRRILRTDNAGDYAAIAVSAAFFAASHLLAARLPGFVPLVVYFAGIFLLGSILAALYRRSGTLICPMLLHGFNNLTAVILIYLQSQV